MGLRAKLLIPFVAGLALLAVLLWVVWAPKFMDDAKQDYFQNQKAVLLAFEGVLVRDYLAGDIAAMYSTLETELKRNPDWRQLLVVNQNGQRIYPLSEPGVLTGGYLLHVPLALRMEGDQGVALTLITDWSQRRAVVIEELLMIKVTLLTVFSLLIGGGLIWQTRWVIEPLQVMRHAAERLVEGDYKVRLPAERADEIGQLSRSFHTMRDELQHTMGRMEASRRDLQESETRQRTILQTVADGVVTLDVNGTICSINQAVERIFDYRADALVGKNISILIIDRERQLPLRHDRLFDVQGVSMELEARHRSGNIFPIELMLNRMELDGEEMFTAVVRDITDRKKVERLKNEFVSTVSHELRTPLTSIRGALGLVNGGALGEVSPRVLEMLSIATSNTERLLLLINDLLDIQKIETGEIDFSLETCEVVALVRQSLEINATYARDRSVSFNLAGGAESSWVRVDVGRFVQIMSNLLSNAAKFSPMGQQVDVSVRAREGMVTIAVADRGPGIPEDFLPKLFDKFTQADASDVREKGGTGLGLSITKALVERLGGTITLETQLGVGTTFFVCLPEVVAESRASA